MTPKEKAKELVSSFYTKTDEQGLTFNIYWSNAKQCSLIAVEEILKSNVVWYEGSIPYKYWQEVKKEICDL
jgi:hypothetical protein